MSEYYIILAVTTSAKNDEQSLHLALYDEAWRYLELAGLSTSLDDETAQRAYIDANYSFAQLWALGSTPTPNWENAIRKYLAKIQMEDVPDNWATMTLSEILDWLQTASTGDKFDRIARVVCALRDAVWGTGLE